MNTNYSEYSVLVSTEPSYYGANCTFEDALEIAPRLTALIEKQFPGIQIRSGGQYVTGPDTEVMDEIREWVESNWTAAL